MIFTLANIIAAVFYTALAAALITQIIRQSTARLHYLFTGICVTLIFHSLGIYGTSVKPDGIQLSFFSELSLTFWVINILVLLSSLKKPLHNLFIFLLPLSALAILGVLLNHSNSSVFKLDFKLGSHVVLSILAWSLLTIATLQALLLAYQNHHLKAKTNLQYLRYLPPLQTIEALLFEFLLVGEILLTLSILTGFVFLENIFAQHLVHKTVFSIAAWFVYAFLLLGKYRLGWRGNTAIRWTLAGFLFLMLAYFGTKLVLEIILHRV